MSSLVFHLALSGTDCSDAGELQARPRRRPCATSYGSSLFCITSTLTPWYPILLSNQNMECYALGSTFGNPAGLMPSAVIATCTLVGCV